MAKVDIVVMGKNPGKSKLDQIKSNTEVLDEPKFLALCGVTWTDT